MGLQSGIRLIASAKSEQLSVLVYSPSPSLLCARATTQAGGPLCHFGSDFDNSVIRFRRKQVRGDVRPISKKKPAPREVPLLPELAETLTAHRVRMAKLGYPTGGDDWVFPTRNGKLKQPSSLANAIASSAKEAQITTHVTPDRMRYMFSDLLRRAGINKVTRKAMVGHVTDEMQEHYSTVMLDEKREAMAAVGATLAEARLAVEGQVRGDDRGYVPRKKKAA
jgi:hypothetical protein